MARKVMTIFICPLCRTRFERPKPYTKGQSSICTECRKRVDREGDESGD